MTFNEKLIDKLIAHFLGQERLKNGAVRRYVPILRKIDTLLIGLFANAYDGTKEQMNDFIRRVRSEKKAVYNRFERELTKELELLSKKESKYLVDLLGGLLTTGLVNRPEKKKIERIIRSEIRGFTIPQMIKTLELNDINKYVSSAKTAISDGLTLQQSISRLKGVTKTSTRNASTIIHTLISSITSQADKAVFESNTHLIKGIKLVVTFDNRTSAICIQHSIDDILYPVDNYPVPGFHFNCRTRAVAITKSFSELAGKTQRKVPVGTRVSMTGDVPVNFTYNDWLKRQTVEIQNDALGRTRATLYRKGEYKLDRFIDPTGKFYTLEELFK